MVKRVMQGSIDSLYVFYLTSQLLDLEEGMYGLFLMGVLKASLV